MRKKIEKGSEEFELWQDLYEFRQQYHDITNDNEDFEAHAKYKELLIKYATTQISEFADEMFTTIITYGERKIYASDS